MVFLRPYVMRNAEDTTRISNDRYDYIFQQQVKFPSESWPLPKVPVLTLPEQVNGSSDAIPAN